MPVVMTRRLRQRDVAELSDSFMFAQAHRRTGCGLFRRSPHGDQGERAVAIRQSSARERGQSAGRRDYQERMAPFLRVPPCVEAGMAS